MLLVAATAKKPCPAIALTIKVAMQMKSEDHTLLKCMVVTTHTLEILPSELVDVTEPGE